VPANGIHILYIKRTYTNLYVLHSYIHIHTVYTLHTHTHGLHIHICTYTYGLRILYIKRTPLVHTHSPSLSPSLSLFLSLSLSSSPSLHNSLSPSLYLSLSLALPSMQPSSALAVLFPSPTTRTGRTRKCINIFDLVSNLMKISNFIKILKRDLFSKIL